MTIDTVSSLSAELEEITVSQAFVCRPDQCLNYLMSDIKTLKVFHINICSINRNFDQCRALIELIDISMDIIVCSECWLSKAPYLPLLDGYNSFQTLNNINQNGGVVIYVKDTLDCKIYEPDCIQEANCLVCEVASEYAIVAVYRSPSFPQIENFLSGLDTLFTTLSSFKFLTLIGDLNIDIKTNTKDSRAGDYLNLNASHGLLPGHTFITRGENCLDHVLIKSKAQATTLVLETALTDHQPTILLANLRRNLQTIPSTRTKTDYDSIHAALLHTDFSPIFNTNDVNFATDFLVSTVSNIIKKCSYSHKVSRSKKTIKPWITTGLLRCIRNRDRMHERLKREPDNMTLKITYMRYRNFINKLLKNTKRNYYKNMLLKAKNNTKCTWNVIKEIANINTTNSNAKALLGLHQDPKISTNLVNNFFVDMGKNLADAITRNQNTPTCPALSYGQPDSMALLEVDVNEIEQLIMGLRRDCSVGWDGISSHILQQSRSVFVPLITHICQLALTSGVFPNAFKKATVHPIYKSGNKELVSNYRPISVLTTLSKILEKVLNKRLVNYLDSKNIIAANQFGFRKGISTEDAVDSLLENVVERLDGKEKCIGIFLDLSKAFDTVSIPILLHKLEHIGIRGLPLAIFRDYLQQRTQSVKIGEHISDEQNVVFGVPQGSILGPTLFTIYINDLCKLSVPHCSIYTYADDTALIITGPNWESARRNAEATLSSVMVWLSANLLTLNLSKTNYITFAMNNSTLPSHNEVVIKAHSCPIPCHNCQCLKLARATSIKYLGVHIDQFLKWDQHIKSLIPRIRTLIYVFKNLNCIADQTLLKRVYYALCQSILTYCITAWGGCAKTTLKHLEVAQRAVLKVMTRKPLRYPTSLLYADTSVMTVRQLFIFKTVLRKHSKLPYDPTLHARKRRSDLVCVTPPHRTVLARRHFKVLSCKLYNRANKILKIYPCTKRDVKRKLESWLESLTYNDTEKVVY